MKKASKSQRRLADKDVAPLLVQSLIKNGLFLQRELSQVCQPHGLNTNQFSVLNEIILQGPMSQKELCERLLFEKSNVSKIVNVLQVKKLITVVVDPVDRRMTLLHETEHGAQLLNECVQNISRSSAGLMEVLSGEDINKVIKILKKLEKSFRRLADR